MSKKNTLVKLRHLGSKAAKGGSDGIELYLLDPWPCIWNGRVDMDHIVRTKQSEREILNVAFPLDRHVYLPQLGNEVVDINNLLDDLTQPFFIPRYTGV